jgi:hypothetical protein
VSAIPLWMRMNSRGSAPRRAAPVNHQETVCARAPEQPRLRNLQEGAS